MGDINAENEALSATWDSLSTEDAEALASTVYGIIGRAKRLASEKDDTFRIATASGSFTLKVANPKENPETLEFQDGALMHLESAAPQVPVPRLVRTLSGHPAHRLVLDDGKVRIVRLLSFIEGMLVAQTTAGIGQCFKLGVAFGQLGLGLRQYSVTPPEPIMWDISHTPGMRRLLPFVGDERRGAVAAVLDDFEKKISPFADTFRRQIIHNDLNPHNILVTDTDPEWVSGIIDFGDMVEAALVNDLAVAASYHLAGDVWLENLCALVEGYNTVSKLEDYEFDALPVLIKSRLAMTLAITEWRSAERPNERDYILRNHPASWKGLQNIGRIPDAALTKLLISSCKD